MANLGMLEARAALADAIPRLTALPPAPTLSGPSTYCTHTSAHGATHWRFEAAEGEQTRDYERLEHVGDALLGTEITLMVHEQYPRLVVGVRTLVKAALVENQALALLSEAYGLPSQIHAAAAQAYALRANPSVRACVWEAFLAAIHEEHGPAKLREFVRAVYSPLLPVAVEAMREVYTVAVPVGPVHPAPNFVGALHEWVQRSPGTRSIRFGEAIGSGAAHAPSWDIECVVRSGTNYRTFNASGLTVKEAKSLVAGQACAAMAIPVY